jgi:L-ascorbate metabolism protein UlaG (beta-lactamase superfamily)
MTKKISISVLVLLITLVSFMVPLVSAAAEHRITANDGDIVFRPIKHASLVISWNKITIYVDPYDKPSLFKGLSAPNLILITDVHEDHMDVETLKAIDTTHSTLVAPSAVAAKLPAELATRVVKLANGETQKVEGVEISAVPMYNIYERKNLHPQGRGNGYIIQLGGKRIYISGDTDDIPEMRTLKNIDVAFLCMIPPYTMSVDQAADAVKAFRPKVVFPYHYQNSDVQRFKFLVEQSVPGTEVKLDNWYPLGN